LALRLKISIFLRTALEREIASKVVKLDDVVRNTPLVLKLVVNYNRQQQIHSTPDEMEFLDINLSKESSFLFYAVHSPVHWRVLKKTRQKSKMRGQLVQILCWGPHPLFIRFRFAVRIRTLSLF
jgi:hypothetical protein